MLLSDVNKNAARAMVILVAIATPLMCLNEVFQFSALLVATDSSYVAAFGATDSHALVLLLMDMHHYGFLIAQNFFDLWLCAGGEGRQGTAGNVRGERKPAQLVLALLANYQAQDRSLTFMLWPRASQHWLRIPREAVAQLFQANVAR